MPSTAETWPLPTMRADSRSKSGCLFCRKRRRKCDERRPQCQACALRGLHCEYSIRLKWAQVKSPSWYKKSPSTASEECPSPPWPPPRRNSDDSQPDSLVSNTGAVGTFTRGTGSPSDLSYFPARVDRPHDESGEEKVQLEQDGMTDGSPSSGAPDFGDLHEMTPQTEQGRRVTGSVDDICSASDHWEVSRPDLGGVHRAILGGDLNPFFETPGEGMAFGYYFRHVSGILSTYDGEGNPYRKLSVFALSSPVVLHTLVAIATEWMFNQGGTRAQVTVARQNRALRSLRQTLSSLVDESPAGKPADRRLTHSKTPFSPHEAALAACLLQVAQVVFSGGTSAEAHLNCSIYLLRELDYIAQPVTSFVARLLTQRFAILDVTAALLHRTRPRAPLSFWMYQVNEDLDFSEPSMHQMTGCPQPVLSALAHIAHLASDLRQFPERKSHILMEGYRLESRLRCWALRRFPEKASFYSDLSHDNEDIQRRFPLASKFHLELVNECFYWLAHLLLQRRIYRDATTSDRVQQTVKTVFGLMKSIPPTSGPASSLPVPFYMVAREAVSDQDRSWVRGMHTSMINVYRNKSRGPMMAMTEEIWRHADLRREASGASQFSNEEDEAQLIALETKNRQFIF